MKFKFCAIVTLLALWSVSARAESLISEQARRENDVPEMRGIFVQGSVGQSVAVGGALAPGISVGYTMPYGGVGASVGAGIGMDPNSSGTIADSTSLSFAVGGHLGKQMGRFRPRATLGVGFIDMDYGFTSWSSSMVSVGAGLDLITDSRIFFSFSVIGFDYYFDPSIGGLSFLNGFGIGYVF